MLRLRFEVEVLLAARAEDLHLAHDVRVVREVGRLDVLPDELGANRGDDDEDEGGPEVERRVEVCARKKSARRFRNEESEKAHRRAHSGK